MGPRAQSPPFPQAPKHPQRDPPASVPSYVGCIRVASLSAQPWAQGQGGKAVLHTLLEGLGRLGLHAAKQDARGLYQAWRSASREAAVTAIGTASKASKSSKHVAA